MLRMAAFDAVVFAVLLAGLAAQLSVVVRHAVRVARKRRSGGGCIGRKTPAAPDAKTELLVSRNIAEARLALWRSFVRLFPAVLSVPALVIVSSILLGAERQHTQQQDVVFLIAFAVCSAARAFPSTVSPRSLSAWYSFCMLILMFYQSPVVNADRFVVHAHTQIISFVISIGNFDFRSSMFWNIVFDAVSVATFLTAEEGCMSDASARRICMQTMYYLSEKLCTLYFLEKLLVAFIRREVEAKQERGLRVAFTSLLSIICDAVVELDSNHLMTEHVPALAHMLLHGAGRSLQGAALDAFIPDESDKLSMQACLMAGGDGNGEASLFHTRMRDAMGNRLPTQCFHVSFRSVDGELRHLIGVREDFDAQRERAPMVELRPQAPRVPWQHARGPLNPAGGSEAASESSTQQGGELQGDVEARPKGPLLITWASDRFRKRYAGELESTDLCDRIPEDNGWREWMTDIADAVWEGRRGGGVVQRFGEVALAPPHNRPGSGRCRRTVSALFPEVEVPRPPRERYRVSLRFTRSSGAAGGGAAGSTGTAPGGGARGDLAAADPAPITEAAGSPSGDAHLRL